MGSDIDSRAQVPAVLLVRLSGVSLCHETDGTGGHVKRVHVVLGEEPNTEPRVRRDETLGRLELACEKLQYRGFTSTVGSNNANSRIQLNIQFDIFKQRSFFGVAETNIGHLNNGRGKLLDFGELEVHNVFAFGSFKNRHALKFLDS